MKKIITAFTLCTMLFMNTTYAMHDRLAANTTSCYTFKQNISNFIGETKLASASPGNMYKDVWNLQTILYLLGYLTEDDTAEGFNSASFAAFNEKTIDALKELQKDENLPETGNLDDATRGWLNQNFACIKQVVNKAKPVKEFTWNGDIFQRAKIEYVGPNFTSNGYSAVSYLLKKEKTKSLDSLSSEIRITKNYIMNGYVSEKLSLDAIASDSNVNNIDPQVVYIATGTKEFISGNEAYFQSFVSRDNAYKFYSIYRIKINNEYYQYRLIEDFEEYKIAQINYKKEIMLILYAKSDKAKQKLLQLISVAPKDQTNFKRSEVGRDLRY